MRDHKKIAIRALAYSAVILAFTTPLAVYTHAAETISSSGAEQTVTTTSQIIATGQFEGRSDHVTKGDVKIVQTAAGYQLVLGEGFYLDGAPDPVIALGNNDDFMVENKISALRNKKGEQVYNLPAGFTPAQFTQAYIWCERFDVPLGIANLTKA